MWRARGVAPGVTGSHLDHEVGPALDEADTAGGRVEAAERNEAIMTPTSCQIKLAMLPSLHLDFQGLEPINPFSCLHLP